MKYLFSIKKTNNKTSDFFYDEKIRAYKELNEEGQLNSLWIDIDFDDLILFLRDFKIFNKYEN
jgi:hypothetical protein